MSRRSLKKTLGAAYALLALLIALSLQASTPDSEPVLLPEAEVISGALVERPLGFKYKRPKKRPLGFPYQRAATPELAG